MGMKDVVLLEQQQITAGTTWLEYFPSDMVTDVMFSSFFASCRHAAGLMVTFGSLSETSTDMRKYSKEMYRYVLL